MLFFFFIFNLLQDCVGSSRRLPLPAGESDTSEKGKKKTPLEGRHAQSEMMLAFSLALISCWRLTKESAAFQVRRSDSSGNSTAPGEENVKSDEFSAPQKTCCGWEVYF